MNYETTAEIEMAIAIHLDWRRNIIVPNISWGAGVHECDIFSVTGAGWATEVEIKVSAADLKKDALKRHGHHSDKIKYLYFAIPAKLLKQWQHIPKRAGIFVVDKKGAVHRLRVAEKNKTARALTEKEMKKIAVLGVLRYWSGRNGSLANKNDLERIKQMLAPDHQKKVFSVKYHRDAINHLMEIPVGDRAGNWSWQKKYHRRELIEAVNQL